MLPFAHQAQGSVKQATFFTLCHYPQFNVLLYEGYASKRSLYARVMISKHPVTGNGAALMQSPQPSLNLYTVHNRPPPLPFFWRMESRLFKRYSH